MKLTLAEKNLLQFMECFVNNTVTLGKSKATRKTALALEEKGLIKINLDTWQVTKL